MGKCDFPIDLWLLILRKKQERGVLSHYIKILYNNWRYSYVVSDNFTTLLKQLLQTSSLHDIALAESFVGVRAEWEHCTLDWIQMLADTDADETMNTILQECDRGEWGKQSSLTPAVHCAILWKYF